MILDGSPATITNVLTQSSLAALLSDEGPSEATSAGVIKVPRYTITNIPPTILSHPRSQTVLPGAIVNLAITAIGTSPIAYRWLSNGIPVLSATNSLFTVTNAQSTDAASYSVAVTNGFGTVTSRVAILQINTNVLAALF